MDYGPKRCEYIEYMYYILTSNLLGYFFAHILIGS